MREERFVKDSAERFTQHVVHEPVSHTGFADVSFLGIKYIRVLVGATTIGSNQS